MKVCTFVQDGRESLGFVVGQDVVDAPLEFREELWTALLERYRRLKRAPAESNRTQAEVPRGATVLPNRWGTAPGIWLEGAPGTVVMLPGVPLEMRMLLEHEVEAAQGRRRALDARGGVDVTDDRRILGRRPPHAQQAGRDRVHVAGQPPGPPPVREVGAAHLAVQQGRHSFISAFGRAASG
jgi:hypothetical protein